MAHDPARAVPAGASIEGARTGRRDLLVLAAVAFASAALVRLHVLPLSVVDWDESIYLLVSRDVLNGKLPYQGGFEHKPAALYYLFALAQVVFGHGVLAIRLLGILACGLTAFLLALLVRRHAAADMPTAAAVAVLYAILSTQNGGWATNTEILLNAYGAAALALMNGGRLFERVEPRRALALGLVFGLMLHTNYLAGLPIAGFGVAYLLSSAQRVGIARAVPLCLGNGLLVAAGFCAASAAVLAPIAIWSDLGDYFGRQIRFLENYSPPIPLPQHAGMVAGAFLPYAALLALAVARVLFLLLGRGRGTAATAGGSLIEMQALVYIGAAFIAANASGRLFPHYFIQMLPGLCVVGGAFLAPLPAAGSLRRLCAVWLVLMAALSLTLERSQFQARWTAVQAWLDGRPADLPTAIARDLRGDLRRDDLIYVFRYEPILYYLLDVPLPARYFFWEHHVRRRYGLNPEAEMTAILAKSPRFVIAGADPENEVRFPLGARLLSAALKRDYDLVKRYPFGKDGFVRIYERRAASATPTAPR
jgi:hypothetical protein